MFAGAALAQTQTMIVSLQHGLVQGHLDAEEDFYSFLDVPYATAPSGADKFKAPLPPPTWTNVFNAVNRGILCPQTRYVSTPGIPVEDCLVASIFVPSTNPTNLSVLVYIHGESYLSGGGLENQLTSLVRTKQVIVVTFNYRLGVQGFLCLGTRDVPGNAGMKDQVALLRWVNRNIARFGGNPNDVTIAGCSAGGASVEYLSLSPMAAGLFKKAIIESGTTFGLTGPQSDPIENAKLYAQRLGFANVDDLIALENLYKSISYDLLLSRTDFLIEHAIHSSSILFAPCVERQTGQERFLYDTPVNILKNGNYVKVPLLYGLSEMPGLIRVQNFNQLKDRMNEDFSAFLPTDLQFESEAQKNAIAQQVKDFYFGDAGVIDQSITSYVNYFTDVLFAYPMLRVANMRRASLGDTIYLYEYFFEDDNMPIIPNTEERGADLCDASLAVADEDVINASEEYKAMKETMRALWLNFITSGNPTPSGSSLPIWPPMSGFLSPVMSIGTRVGAVPSSFFSIRYRFWDDIYDDHYNAPVPPGGVPPTPTPPPSSEDTSEPTPAPSSEDTPAPPTEPTPAPPLPSSGSAATSTISLLFLVNVLVIKFNFIIS